MHRGPFAIVSFFEHREVNDPKRRPLASCQFHVMTDFDTYSTHCIIDDFGFVRTEEYDVAIFSAHTFQQVQHDWLDEFHDWRLKTFDTFFKFVDFDISQTFCTVDTDKFGVFINLATWQ